MIQNKLTASTKIKIMLIVSISVCMCFVMLFGIFDNGVFANDQLQQKTDELNKIENELKRLDKKRSEKKYENNKILRKIRDIENDMRSIDKDIEALDAEIALTDMKIYDAEGSLKLAEENILMKKELLNKRLRVMYKSGDIGYMEVLLGANDFQDLMSRMDMLQKIYRHDVDLIEYMNGEKLKVIEKKKQLEAYRNERQAQKESWESKMAMLDANINKLNEVKKGLAQDISALKIKEDELEEDAKKLTALLQSMKVKKKYVGGSMIWPAPGHTKITSPFGYRIHPITKVKKLHTGTDIGIRTGGTIVAAQSGRVIKADWFGGYGKCVMIDHGGGIVTLYAHNSKLLVKSGQEVKAGDKIAESGSTGNSTGPHLHFEVRVNGKPTNPVGKYINP